jgi:hypothetical protein
MRRVSRVEGKTKNEIMRCVKRYIAREIYRAVRDLVSSVVRALACRIRACTVLM